MHLPSSLPEIAISAVVLDIFGELHNHTVSYYCAGSRNCWGFFAGGYAFILQPPSEENLPSQGSFLIYRNVAQIYFQVDVFQTPETEVTGFYIGNFIFFHNSEFWKIIPFFSDGLFIYTLKVIKPKKKKRIAFQNKI